MRSMHLCLSCGYLLPLLDSLNRRKPLSRDRKTTKLALIHLCHSQSQPLRPMELVLCVEDCWMESNAKVLSRCRYDFARASFYSYVVKTMKNVNEIHKTVVHRSRDFTALLDTKWKAILDLSHDGRDLVMKQFHIFHSPNFIKSA